MKIIALRLVSLVPGMLLLLEPPTAPAATINWVGGSGDWDTATNWSTGQLPGPADDVVIGSGPSITVTHSTGADTVNSITSQQAFQLSGGSLTVSNNFQINSTLTLSGGTLVQAIVSLGGGTALIVQPGGVTLDGLTVNGILDVGNTFNETSLEVTNGLTLNGTMLVGNPTNSNWA